jgi:hypothetical protein
VVRWGGDICAPTLPDDASPATSHLQLAALLTAVETPKPPSQYDRLQQAPGSRDEHIRDAADLKLSDVEHEKIPNRIQRPQSTFTIGEDCPSPGGEANGVGNERPDWPLTKCGTAFTRKPPPKKYSRSRFSYSAREGSEG